MERANVQLANHNANARRISQHRCAKIARTNDTLMRSNPPRAAAAARKPHADTPRPHQTLACA
eukprot:2623865-Lingulodinium_polyedra.AAC.1